MKPSRVITTNAGRGGYTGERGNGHRNHGIGGQLDATRHVEAHSHVGDDGYTIMDAYNAGFGKYIVTRRAGAQG